MGAKKAFQKSVTSPARPAFDFDAAVAEAYERHPETKANIFFLDVAHARPSHPDANTRAGLAAILKGHEEWQRDLAEELKRRKITKSSAMMELGAGDGAAYFAFLYLKKDMQSALGAKHDVDENLQMVFDHEFAHALIPQAHGATPLAESTADVYSAIRFFQRHGTDNDTIEKLMKRRAVHAALNQDIKHFTAPALEYLLQMKHDMDFKALTPAETISAAEFIAREATPDDKTLKNLARHFNKFASVMLHVTDDAPLRLLAETVFKSRSPDVKKWGGMALGAFLDNHIKLRTDAKNVKLTGSYWEDARNKLARLG